MLKVGSIVLGLDHVQCQLRLKYFFTKKKSYPESIEDLVDLKFGHLLS